MVILGTLVYGNVLLAANYIVSTKSTLISKMKAANPGDTVTVANGTYSWGQVSITNTNGNSIGAWIVLIAQTFNGVVFEDSTYLQFSGTHILISGFRFANGNSQANNVIQFRDKSGTFANYCRLTNITIDNYNSDSTGSYNNTGSKNGGDILNEWVAIYGVHNRVDHCTFINKFNGSPTMVIWYDSTNYPAKSTPTYDRIDSNYFKLHGYQGANEGEVIRVGTSENSRTSAYNVIEYNLFEDGVQIDPEIISNKSAFNTYRYNTFRNHAGGLTLREGRYCSVYGNFFIKTTTPQSTQYGIRVIDKGHKVFNNYLENLDGNASNSLTTNLRCPIILYNGVTYSSDTTDPYYANLYFAADSAIIAFNTIVNCVGGAGIVLGFNGKDSSFYKPQGILVANNLIEMSKGQAAYADTGVTFSAEGNMYKAPHGLGLTTSTGFTSETLTFGARVNGILQPPSIVQDAAVNTSNYVSLLNGLDVLGKNRSPIYDVGAEELNGTGNIIAYPLDSTLVGAGTPLQSVPVRLISFTASLRNATTDLKWTVANETNLKQYQIEYSTDGISFKELGNILATNQSIYNYEYNTGGSPKNYFRLKLINEDGSFVYSSAIVIDEQADAAIIRLYPNPSTGNININATNIKPNTFIVITDYTGRILKQSTIAAGLNNINVNGLGNGMYLIQMKEEGKTVSNYPFIISR